MKIIKAIGVGIVLGILLLLLIASIIVGMMYLTEFLTITLSFNPQEAILISISTLIVLMVTVLHVTTSD